MKKENITSVLKKVRSTNKKFGLAVVTDYVLGDKKNDKTVNLPFLVLVSTLLSLRTKDPVTKAATDRLFDHIQTPAELIKLPINQVEKLIYPVGFYKTKAKNLLTICQTLLNDHQGKVPDELEKLLALPGVGLKTANLVLSLGFGIPAICVDTHVHRIVNRWGLIQTENPDKTEAFLKQVLPKKHWIEINDLLVVFGQNICRPTSPFCSKCPITKDCKQISVSKSR